MVVHFTEVFGNPYKRGYESGKMFSQALKKESSNYIKILSDDVIMRKLSEILALTRITCPDYLNEVLGRADGAGIPFDIYWAMMCAEVLDKVSHCTTIVARKPDGSLILSHNEDDYYTEDTFCMTKVNTSSGWFVTNDNYNMPFGNGFSWNSSGIVKTVNYCHEPHPDLAQLPRYFLQRHISEAASIEDFVKRCTDFPVASGFHSIALDKINNVAVSVEIYPDGISVETIDDCYIHSNHYVHKKWNDNICTDRHSNSVFRLEKARKLMQANIYRSINSIKHILEYRGTRFEDSIWQNRNDPYLTVVNFSLDTADNELLLLHFYLTNEKFNIGYKTYSKISIENFDDTEKNWAYERVVNSNYEDAIKLLSGRVDYDSIEKKNELDTDDIDKKNKFIVDTVLNKYPNMAQKRKYPPLHLQK